MIGNKKITGILLIIAFLLIIGALIYDIFVEKSLSITVVVIAISLIIYATVIFLKSIKNSK